MNLFLFTSSTYGSGEDLKKLSYLGSFLPPLQQLFRIPEPYDQI
jgi:hypothetical protein